MAIIAIMGSLGALLMLWNFPIGIAPAFYKLDLSDVPCLIGSFALGPLCGVLIVLVKVLIKLLLKPTSTAFVGEITVFCISAVYCLSASLIYQQQKNRRNAIKALIISSLIMTFVACAGNYFFIIEAYVQLYDISMETILAMGQAIFPAVDDKLSFVLCCVLPFNLIKCGITDVVTFLLYKRISPLLKGINR